MKDEYQEIDKLFFDEGYRLASHILSDGLSPSNFLSLMSSVYEITNSFLESFSGKIKSENRNIDCKKGCYWCCAQTVYANPIEQYFLTEFIRKNFSQSEQEAILQKAGEKHFKTTGLNSEERLQNRHFCPLLKDGICSVYDARPTACRIYLSMDIESCLQDFKYPLNQKVFPQLYTLPLHAGRMLNEGIAAWLAEKNLNLKEDSLEAGLFYFLKEKNAFEKWINTNEEETGYENDFNIQV